MIDPYNALQHANSNIKQESTHLLLKEIFAMMERYVLVLIYFCSATHNRRHPFGMKRLVLGELGMTPTTSR